MRNTVRGKAWRSLAAASGILLATRVGAETIPVVLTGDQVLGADLSLSTDASSPPPLIEARGNNAASGKLLLEAAPPSGPSSTAAVVLAPLAGFENRGELTLSSRSQTQLPGSNAAYVTAVGIAALADGSRVGNLGRLTVLGLAGAIDVSAGAGNGVVSSTGIAGQGAANVFNTGLLTVLGQGGSVTAPGFNANASVSAYGLRGADQSRLSNEAGGAITVSAVGGTATGVDADARASAFAMLGNPTRGGGRSQALNDGSLSVVAQGGQLSGTGSQTSTAIAYGINYYPGAADVSNTGRIDIQALGGLAGGGVSSANIHAFAYGLAGGAGSSLNNSGSITLRAQGGTMNEAQAQATAYATAYGLYLVDGGSQTNRGAVDIETRGGGVTGTDGQAYATAYGMSSQVGPVPDERPFLLNDGRVTVTAQGGRATLSNGGTRGLNARAEAYGMRGDELTDLSNLKQLIVTSRAGSVSGSGAVFDAIATATGLRGGTQGTADNLGVIQVEAVGGQVQGGRRSLAYASAYGILTSASAAQQNSGSIVVVARGGQAASDGKAEAYARAYGMAGEFARLEHRGRLNVNAAGGVASGTDTDASAEAVGVKLSGPGAGAFVNEGEILVNAVAGRGAQGLDRASAAGIASAGGAHSLLSNHLIAVSAQGNAMSRAHEVWVQSGSLSLRTYRIALRDTSDPATRPLAVDAGASLDFDGTRLVLSPGRADQGFAYGRWYPVRDMVNLADDSSALGGAIAAVSAGPDVIAHPFIHARVQGDSIGEQSVALAFDASGVAGAKSGAQSLAYTSLDGERWLTQALDTELAGGGQRVFAIPIYRRLRSDADGGAHGDSEGLVVGFNAGDAQRAAGASLAFGRHRFSPEAPLVAGSHDTSNWASLGLHGLGQIRPGLSWRAGINVYVDDNNLHSTDTVLAASASAQPKAWGTSGFATLMQDLSDGLALEGGLSFLTYRREGYHLRWNSPAASWRDAEVAAASEHAWLARTALRWNGDWGRVQPMLAVGGWYALSGAQVRFDQTLAGGIPVAFDSDPVHAAATLDAALSAGDGRQRLSLGLSGEFARETRSGAVWLRWELRF